MPPPRTLTPDVLFRSGVLGRCLCSLTVANLQRHHLAIPARPAP